MSDGAIDQAALDKADPARAAALDAALDASTARAKAANDALQAAASHPDILAAAKALLNVAEAVAPTVAGLLGGPGAAAIATIAVGIESQARAAASKP